MGIYINQYFIGIKPDPPFEMITGVSSYGGVLGSFFFVWGQHPIIARFSNVLIGSILILIVYNFSKRLKFSDGYALLAASIIAFMPTYIFYSTLIYRDILLCLFTFSLLTYWVKFLLDDRLRYLVIGLTIAIISIPFRKQFAPILTLCFLILLVAYCKNILFHLKGIRIRGITTILILFSTLILGVGAMSLIQYEISTWGNKALIEYFNDQSNYRGTGGSVYLTHIQYNSLLDIVKYLPIKFLYFTFGPFLWSANTNLIFLSSLESLIGWFSFIIIMINFKKLIILKDKYGTAILFIFAFAIISLVAMSIVDSNFGTATRHRLIYMPIIYIVSIWTLQGQKRITA
jgi:4-amino-4-deoxy-L-arabinose transferase-like glycosyltransferase